MIYSISRMRMAMMTLGAKHGSNRMSLLSSSSSLSSSIIARTATTLIHNNNSNKAAAAAAAAATAARTITTIVNYHRPITLNDDDDNDYKNIKNNYSRINNNKFRRRTYSSTLYRMDSEGDDDNTKTNKKKEEENENETAGGEKEVEEVQEEEKELSEEEIAAIAAKREAKEKKKELRRRALEYNDARASYKRRVSLLRKEYTEEVESYKKEDEAALQADREIKTRRRLERQRAKNERSLVNALRQKELQRQQRLVFEDHLRQQQEIREDDHNLHQRARQLLIDELEVESKLWLTSVEEVEKAFADPNTEQLLWVKPQSALGVPNPSLDSHFWSYEGHTWDRSRTYKTKAEILLEKLEQKVYDDTNVSKSVWSTQKEDEYESLVKKAKLRALVRQAGRKSLLRRQREYIEADQQDVDDTEPPKPMPTPSLGVLANIKAQEKEGAELLLKNPRQFFVFANENNDGSSSNDKDDAADENYSGPSLGKPIDIRDPLRTGQPQGRVFPQVIGKLPKADQRTEKEKKRAEREERLWAAAQMKSASSDDDDIELLAEEDREFGEPIDYEEAELNWDSDDERWEKGLDPDLDGDLLNVPREYRFFDDDIDRVVQELQKKADSMQSHVKNAIRTMEEEARSRVVTTSTDSTTAAIGRGVDENTTADDTTSFFDEETTQQLINVGADVDKYETLMSSLSRDQLLSLFALEAKDNIVADDDDDDDIDVDGGGDYDSSSSSSPSTKVFEEIPGLTDQQIADLTEMESFIRIAEKQQQQQEQQE